MSEYDMEVWLHATSIFGADLRRSHLQDINILNIFQDLWKNYSTKSALEFFNRWRVQERNAIHRQAEEHMAYPMYGSGFTEVQRMDVMYEFMKPMLISLDEMIKPVNEWFAAPGGE